MRVARCRRKPTTRGPSSRSRGDARSGPGATHACNTGRVQGEGTAEEARSVGPARAITALSWVKVLLALLGGLVLLLLMSGTYLALRYVPDGAVRLFRLGQPEAPWLVSAA